MSLTPPADATNYCIQGLQYALSLMNQPLLDSDTLLTLLLHWMIDKSFEFCLTAIFKHLLNPIFSLWQRPLPVIVRAIRLKYSQSDFAKTIKLTALG
jgi:hypothetical protein